jgi:single-strand DNA-binding protein
MAYEIEGTIKQIGEAQTFASGFAKREIVITTEDRFPQDIALEALKEKMDLLEGFKSGEKVKASFDIRGREYQGRHFVNLTIWKLERSGETGGAADSGNEAEEIEPDEEVPF